MQVTKKNLSDTKVELTLIADADLMKTVKNETLKHLAQDMRLQGFRAGKAPLAMVEKNADPAALQSEFLDRAMNHLYGAAIDQEKLRPISQPEVKINKFVPFDTLELQLTVEVVGDITLPDYTKIKLEKKTVKVTAKDVDGVINQLKARGAEDKDVDRAAKKGDKTWIDFAGVDAKTKEAIKGADGKDYPLPIGSDTFIPGFEENVIGLKAGDTKTFTLEFPKDYGVKALQSRKVSFTITVNKVQEVIEPVVDDEFATKVGPFKTVDDMKSDIKKQLTAEKEQEADRTLADEVLTAVTKKSKVAIPAALIEEQIDRIVQDQRQNLTYRGQTWQEFLDEQDLTDETYRAQVKPDAEFRVKAGLILSKVAEKEKVTVTTEEQDIRMQLYRGQYTDKQMQSELDKPEARREIASRMLTEKTIAKLVEYATAK